MRRRPTRERARAHDDLPDAGGLFVNGEDSRAISDTIVIYPDADTAARTLREALPTIDQVVAGATPRPVPVGQNGTIAVGMSPDGGKAVTLLLFTEGPALARLEFQRAPGAMRPPTSSSCPSARCSRSRCGRDSTRRTESGVVDRLQGRRVAGGQVLIGAGVGANYLLRLRAEREKL